jgi:hypothetical protein
MSQMWEGPPLSAPAVTVCKQTGKALHRPLEKLEVQVQRRNAELSQANKALREDAKRLSAVIATQYDIATAGHNFIDVMTLIAERTQKLTRAKGAAIELIERRRISVSSGNRDGVTTCRAATGDRLESFGTMHAA